MRSDSPRRSVRKVLVIGPVPPPYNGMSVVTETIMNSTLKDMFNLVNLDTADRRGFANVGRVDLVNIYLAIVHFLKFLWMLIKERPNVVYVPVAQNFLGYLRDSLFLIPAKLFRKKVIVHLHGGHFRQFYEGSSRPMRVLIRLTLQGVQRAIVLGDILKPIFDGLIPSERIAVVPNGVGRSNVDSSKSGFPSAYECNGQLRVLFLGALAKDKGFLDLLHAIPEILVNRKDVGFVFAGELLAGKGKEEAMSFVAQEKLNPFVSFPGVVTGGKKRKLLSSCDVFVFPSHCEGQPLVVLEAMASGLPVITTDVGAIRETVIDGENGFIVEKQSPPEVAEKILMLLNDEELRREMGQKNRERFLRYYTKDRFVSNLSRVFDAVLSEQ